MNEAEPKIPTSSNAQMLYPHSCTSMSQQGGVVGRIVALAESLLKCVKGDK